MRKKIIIGNWKMNKNLAETKEFISEFSQLSNGKKINCDYGIAASFTNLVELQKNFKNTDFIISAQNCHYQLSGAYTGEISMSMLEDLSVSHIIIGHSERRQYFNETDEVINQKINSIFANSKMIPILCCGETLQEYETNKTIEVIKRQITADLKNISSEDVMKLVIAYEPIWAIGTGKTATAQQAQETIAQIRKILADLYNEKVADNIRIQYGGSVNPKNIKEILQQPDIDGALVGGASLKATDFNNLLF